MATLSIAYIFERHLHGDRLRLSRHFSLLTFRTFNNPFKLSVEGAIQIMDFLFVLKYDYATPVFNRAYSQQAFFYIEYLCSTYLHN